MSASASASAQTTATNAPELTFTAIAKSLLAGGVAGGVCVRDAMRCDARAGDDDSMTMTTTTMRGVV